jgi:2-polyprenyl-3-methyl-5-hydroxy-6-metoxy-1,4-benzoquinol methylase
MVMNATNERETGGRRISWDPDEHYKDIAVAERYDDERFSSLAGRLFNALEKASLRRALKGIPKTSHFIDVPCGTGRLAEVLLEMGYRVTGVDIAPAMLHVAKRKLARFGDRFDTLVQDARTLKEAGYHFDAALCARVLMHFPLSEQIDFLRGVQDVTTGPILLSQSLSTPYHAFRRRMKGAMGHQPPAAYPISETELHQLLSACGLEERGRTRAMPLMSEAILVKATR